MGEFSASEIAGSDYTPPHAGCEATIASLTAQLAARGDEVARLRACLEALADIASEAAPLSWAAPECAEAAYKYEKQLLPALQRASALLASTAPRAEGDGR